MDKKQGFKNEKTFQKLIRSNEKVRLSFLKSFLPLPEDRSIEKVEDLGCLLPDAENYYKRAVTDLRLTLDNKERPQVRIIMCGDNFTQQEALFLWGQNYRAQLKPEDSLYKPLYTTYFLAFCDFDFLGPEKKRFYNRFSIRTKEGLEPVGLACLLHLQIVYVELSKFKEKDINELSNLRKAWCYLLREYEDMKDSDKELFSAKSPEMKELMDLAQSLIG